MLEDVMKITHASNLSDNALIEELNRLAGRERAATVALIVRLAEFDARRLYAGAGYSSTFRYCLEVLRLSEDAAFNRIEVARTARDHPLVLEMLLSGALSPTTARLLARRLRAENHCELLAVAAGKSKQQVEELLARRVTAAAWVASNGRRCGERRFLEFHHDDPWAAGGQPTVDRVRLLCGTHNGHEAEVFHGPGRRYGHGGTDVAGETASATGRARGCHPSWDG